MRSLANLVLLLLACCATPAWAQVFECCHPEGCSTEPGSCASYLDVLAAGANAYSLPPGSVALITLERTTFEIDYPLLLAYDQNLKFSKEVSIVLRPAGGEGERPIFKCVVEMNQPAIQFGAAGNHTFNGIKVQNCGTGAVLFDLLDHDGTGISSIITIDNSVFFNNSNAVFQPNFNSEPWPDIVNYTGAVQVIGGGVELQVINTVFLSNLGVDFDNMVADSHEGIGAHALAVNLLQGGRVNMQGVNFSHNGGVTDNPYATSWVSCTDHLLASSLFLYPYSNAVVGTCIVQVSKSTLEFNVATVVPGLEVLCGNLACGFFISESIVKNNTFSSTLWAQSLTDPATTSLPCITYQTSTLSMSGYSSGFVNVADSQFFHNYGTVISNDLCGSNPFDITISDSLFGENSCIGCTYREDLDMTNKATGGPGLFIREAKKFLMNNTIFVANYYNTSTKRETAATPTSAIMAVDVSAFTLTNCNLTSNSFYRGGAITVKRLMKNLDEKMTVVLDNNYFFGNKILANGSFLEPGIGGAVGLEGIDDITITNGRFIDNAVEGDRGGAVSIRSNTTVNAYIAESEFSGNTLNPINASDRGEGAALALDFPGNVNMDNSYFHDNAAAGISLTGGAISVRKVSKFKMNNSTFFNNSAGQGGAIRFISPSEFTQSMDAEILGCSFDSNVIRIGYIGAGAISFEGCNDILIGESQFVNNQALNIGIDDSGQNVGGALWANSVSGAFEIRNCSFEGNQAFLGGAITAQSTPHMLIHDSIFTNNKGAGASVYINNGVSLNVWKCTFDGGFGWNDNFEEQIANGRIVGTVQTNAGGAIQAATGASLSIASSNFTNNVANAGGAIFTWGGSRLEVDIGWFYAQCGGKAAFVYEGDFSTFWSDRLDPAILVNDVVCYLPGSSFTNNTAYSGGALLIVDSSARIVNDNVDMTSDQVFPNFNGVMFLNNTAFSGGAMSVIRGEPTNIFQSYLLNNTALPSAIPEPLAYPNNSYSISQYESLASGVGCGLGCGGAICQTCSGLCDDERLANVTISGNEAVFGGGIFIGSVFGGCLNPDACWKLQLRQLQKIDLNLEFKKDLIINTEPLIQNNYAYGGGGGGVFMNHRGIITSECTEYATLPLAEVVVNDDAGYQPCLSWTGNTVEDGGFGETMASSPVSFEITQPDLSIYNSGEFISYKVGIFDIYNQAFNTTVDTGPIGATVVISAIDPATSGQRDILINGRVNPELADDRIVTTLRLIDHPGPHDIPLHGKLDMLGRTLPVVVLDITIRKCRLGEISVFNFTLCERCKVGTFSLDPLGSDCQPCPDNAQCNLDEELSGIIVPDPGYFNSNPFSDQIHECGSDTSCDYPDRQERLTLYQYQIIMDQITYNKTSYIEDQCTLGYTGALCATCIAGYGATNEGCQECPNKNIGHLWHAAVNIATFVMILTTTWLTLNRQEVLHTADAEEEVLAEDIPVSTIIKVFVSYLQIISGLGDLPLIGFPSSLQSMFEFFDMIVSVPGSLINIDCSFNPDSKVPPTMQTILFIIFSPVYTCILWAVIFMIFPWTRPIRVWLKCCVTGSSEGADTNSESSRMSGGEMRKTNSGRKGVEMGKIASTRSNYGREDVEMGKPASTRLTHGRKDGEMGKSASTRSNRGREDVEMGKSASTRSNRGMDGVQEGSSKRASHLGSGKRGTLEDTGNQRRQGEGRLNMGWKFGVGHRRADHGKPEAKRTFGFKIGRKANGEPPSAPWDGTPAPPPLPPPEDANHEATPDELDGSVNVNVGPDPEEFSYNGLYHAEAPQPTAAAVDNGQPSGGRSPALDCEASSPSGTPTHSPSAVVSARGPPSGGRSPALDREASSPSGTPTHSPSAVVSTHAPLPSARARVKPLTDRSATLDSEAASSVPSYGGTGSDQSPRYSSGEWDQEAGDGIGNNSPGPSPSPLKTESSRSLSKNRSVGRSGRSRHMSSSRALEDLDENTPVEHGLSMPEGLSEDDDQAYNAAAAKWMAKHGAPMPGPTGSPSMFAAVDRNGAELEETEPRQQTMEDGAENDQESDYGDGYYRYKPGEMSYWQKWYRNFIVATLITIFFFYENVVDGTLSLFVCEGIDMPVEEPLSTEAGLFLQTYWDASPIYECYKDTHMYITFIVGIPTLIVFCAGCPLASAGFLYWNFERLADLDFLNFYGFIYREYVPMFFYWESVIMARKLIFTLAKSYIINEDPATQVLVLLAIIAFSLVIHMICNPYSERVVGRLEFWQLLVTLVSLYLCCFLVPGDDSEEIKINAVGFIILVLNAALFIVFCLVIFYTQVLSFLSGEGVEHLKRDRNTGAVDRGELKEAIKLTRQNKLVVAVMVPVVAVAIRLEHRMARFSRLTTQDSYSSSDFGSDDDKGGFEEVWDTTGKPAFPVLAPVVPVLASIRTGPEDSAQATARRLSSAGGSLAGLLMAGFSTTSANTEVDPSQSMLSQTPSESQMSGSTHAGTPSGDRPSRDRPSDDGTSKGFSNPEDARNGRTDAHMEERRSRDSRTSRNSKTLREAGNSNKSDKGPRTWSAIAHARKASAIPSPNTQLKPGPSNATDSPHKGSVGSVMEPADGRSSRTSRTSRSSKEKPKNLKDRLLDIQSGASLMHSPRSGLREKSREGKPPKTGKSVSKLGPGAQTENPPGTTTSNPVSGTTSAPVTGATTSSLDASLTPTSTPKSNTPKAPYQPTGPMSDGSYASSRSTNNSGRAQ